jgi:hypothetical protein
MQALGPVIQQAHACSSLAFSFSGGGFMLPYFAGAWLDQLLTCGFAQPPDEL